MSPGAAAAPEGLTDDLLDHAGPLLVFHARPKLAGGLQAGHFKLLQALGDHARDQGLETRIVTFSRAGQRRAMASGRHYHVIMDDMPGYAANCVYCVPSYLNGFWFLDEIGTRNNSQMRLGGFDPAAILWAEARPFVAALEEKFITANRSRLQQAPRGAAIEPGSLCLFLQGFDDQPYHRHFMSAEDFIQAAIAVRGARRLYLKPHPGQNPAELTRILRYHDPAAGVEVTDASIHDLIPAAHCVLTLTSAVGFEAFLHRKPVVLGGQTDFWQNAVTVTRPGALAAAIEAAVSRDWPYKKFLTWYLRHRCLEDSAAALPRALERLFRKGWLWADPGTGWF